MIGLLVEAWEVRSGRKPVWVRVWAWVRVTAGRFWELLRNEWWYAGRLLREVGLALGELFGRPKKESHTFTWWTYYVAVKQSLRHARIAKSMCAAGAISAWDCCAVYDRYEGVQKRARARGYTKLANESIHDKWILKY